MKIQEGLIIQFHTQGDFKTASRVHECKHAQTPESKYVNMLGPTTERRGSDTVLAWERHMGHGAGGNAKEAD